MKTRKFTIIPLLFVCLMTSLKAQQHYHTIHLNIEGMKFDSVAINFAVPKNRIIYKGTTVDNCYWKFQIPDSTFKDYFIANVDGYLTKNKDKEARHRLIFKSDTINTPGFTFTTIFMDNIDSIPINIKYLNTINGKKKSEIYSYFRILKGTDPEIPRTAIFYEKYFEWGDGDLPYEDIIANYTQLVKTYPDSYALIKTVKMFSDWPKAEDMENIFSYFSDRIKKCDQGLFIRNYIDRKLRFTKFENIKLPNWQTGEPEYIISDTTKPCLVVFSASWCGPCHKMIPTLKEIYYELKDKLNIVYVSTDRNKTRADWRKMMMDKNIPWRSVLTEDEKGSINDKYFITSIPYAYLVYPDGSFEECDVRDENSREKLRQL